MANPQNFKPTIERLLKRPSWVVDSGRALVGCMCKGGCDQVIDIELPTTLEEAGARIRAEGWVYETHNGMHMCPVHGKEFYMGRTRRAQITKQAKFKRADLLASAGYPRFDPKESNSPAAEVAGRWISAPKPPPVPLPVGVSEPKPYLHSPAASRGLRKMFTLLDDHFDVKRGRYIPGWSDEKVAQECNLAASAVAHYRDEAYGVLRTVDEATLRDIKRLDAALIDMQAKMDQFCCDLAVIKGKIRD